MKKIFLLTVPRKNGIILLKKIGRVIVLFKDLLGRCKARNMLHKVILWDIIYVKIKLVKFQGMDKKSLTSTFKECELRLNNMDGDLYKL